MEHRNARRLIRRHVEVLAVERSVHQHAAVLRVVAAAQIGPAPQDLAGVDVHDQPGAALGGEVVDHTRQFFVQDVLQPQIDRQLHWLLPPAQTVVRRGRVVAGDCVAACNGDGAAGDRAEDSHQEEEEEEAMVGRVGRAEGRA